MCRTLLNTWSTIITELFTAKQGDARNRSAGTANSHGMTRRTATSYARDLRAEHEFSSSIKLSIRMPVHSYSPFNVPVITMVITYNLAV